MHPRTFTPKINAFGFCKKKNQLSGRVFAIVCVKICEYLLLKSSIILLNLRNK